MFIGVFFGGVGSRGTIETNSNSTGQDCESGLWPTHQLFFAKLCGLNKLMQPTLVRQFFSPDSIHKA